VSRRRLRKATGCLSGDEIDQLASVKNIDQPTFFQLISKEIRSIVLDMPVLARHLEPRVVEAIAAVPVVVIEGGRATGKSTLCDRLISAHGWAPRLDLSDQDTLEILRLDPLRFLDAQPTPCIIDEAQLEPQLTLWVKQIVDRRGSVGQFILTGSARLGRDRLGGSDPLAGRCIRLQLWSMTQAELEGRSSDVIDAAFGNGWPAGERLARPTRDSWVGGLPSIPGVLEGIPHPSWERATASYIEAVLPLGAGQSRADLGRLARTFRYLAAASGQHLNLARAASELAMQAATVKSHIEILEAGFLLTRFEAHRPSEHRVVTAHPKIMTTDAGLATWASRARDAPPTAAVVGWITETVVGHELAAAAASHNGAIVVRHWRDNRAQTEVDFLMCHPDGRYVPVEVKASSTVGPADTKGLQAFAAEAPRTTTRGIIIYQGDRIIDLTPPDSPVPFVALPQPVI